MIPVMDCCFELSCGDRWEFKGRLNECSSKRECTWFVHIRSMSFYLCYSPSLVEHITLSLDSTNKVEQWYVRHN